MAKIIAQIVITAKRRLNESDSDDLTFTL